MQDPPSRQPTNPPVRQPTLADLIAAAMPMPWQTPLSAGQIIDKLGEPYEVEGVRRILIKMWKAGRIERVDKGKLRCYRWALVCRGQRLVIDKRFDDLGKGVRK
jgi:hypothetical protein